MLKDLGINGGTLIACLLMGYFVIKWAVKNAILEAHYSITGEKSEEEKMVERMMEEDEERRRKPRKNTPREKKRRKRRRERRSDPVFVCQDTAIGAK